MSLSPQCRGKSWWAYLWLKARLKAWLAQCDTEIRTSKQYRHTPKISPTGKRDGLHKLLPNLTWPMNNLPLKIWFTSRNETWPANSLVGFSKDWLRSWKSLGLKLLRPQPKKSIKKKKRKEKTSSNLIQLNPTQHQLGD